MVWMQGHADWLEECDADLWNLVGDVEDWLEHAKVLVIDLVDYNGDLEGFNPPHKRLDSILTERLAFWCDMKASNINPAPLQKLDWLIQQFVGRAANSSPKPKHLLSDIEEKLWECKWICDRITNMAIMSIGEARNAGSQGDTSTATSKGKSAWHSPEENPPDEFSYGPLRGTLKDLASWIVPGADKRTLDTPIADESYIWGQQVHRTQRAVWFNNEKKYAECNARRIAEQQKQ